MRDQTRLEQEATTSNADSNDSSFMSQQENSRFRVTAKAAGESLMKAIGSVIWRTPLRRYRRYYRYLYNFTPEQLCFFVNCLSHTRDVDGDILEIGCAQGNTACFLNRHLQVSGINKDYYCIDTFSGFSADDVAFEATQRGKKPWQFTGFRYNSLLRVEYTLKRNGCDRVKCIQTDVKKYTVSSPVSFCLLDVDLYLPTLHALRQVWPMLSLGGMIVVDDCVPNNIFDGALQAYVEFVREAGVVPQYTLGKLGILRKDLTTGAGVTV